MNRFLNKYLFRIAGILFSVFPAMGNNVISLSGVQGEPGSEVTVKVSLNSTEAISALQITAPLDDAASAITESGKVLNRAAGHSISCGTKDGNLNLMIYSTGMNTIAVGSGEVAEFKLKLGELPLSVSPVVSVKATDANGKEISCQAENWTINVSGALAEYPRGVAYDFGRVPLRDSYTISIPVRNNGCSQLVIYGLEFSAPEFTAISSLPFKVEAGNTANLEIGYSPVERGPVTESMKLISNSYSPNNVLKLLADPFAVNEIHIQNVTGTSDSEVEIVVAMNNMDKITGFTLEFDLPSQLEYIVDPFVLSDRKTDHVVSASYTDSKLKATAYSLSNAGFKEEEGKLASFKVKLKGRNSASLKPSKAVLSALIKDRVEDVTSAVYAGQITVQYPYLYASNSLSLGRTPITKAISVPLRVINYGSAPLIIERAVVEGIDLSVKNDFPIEISSGSNTDIILNLDGKNEGVLKGTLQLYSNDPENRMFNVALSGERYAPNSISLIGGNVINTTEQGVLSVSLDNYDEISGFQFDVTYPSGFEPREPVITERTQGFSVNFSKMGNNTVRYICYSLSGNSISSGSGDVFELPFSFASNQATGSYQFVMSNVKLSTPEGINKSSVIDNPSTLLTIVPYVAVESISLNKTVYEGNPNTTLLLNATISPADATEQMVIWTSSDNSVATVNESGLVNLLKLGNVNITASCENKSATCEITVIPVFIAVQSVSLNAESVEMLLGDQVTLTAKILPADATDQSLIWSSSDVNVVSINNGILTAIGLGEAEIKVETTNGKEAICVVKVNPVLATSVTLNHTSYAGRQGDSFQLIATVSPENTTDKTVNWSSSDTGVATVNENGLVSLIGVGSAAVTASCGDVNATCQITVEAPLPESIALTPAMGTVKVEETLQLSAVVNPSNAEYTLIWSSSNPQVATVSETGLVTGVSVGNTTITVRTDNGLEATCEVSVLTNIVEVSSVALDKTTYTGKEGTTVQLNATVSPDNATDNSVTWSSNNTQVASVSNSGLVSLISEGTATISATAGSKSATCRVTVEPNRIEVTSISLDKTDAELKIGESIVLTSTINPANATDKSVSWSSSDNNVATVSDGKITGISVGTATITVTASNGMAATCSVVVYSDQPVIVEVTNIQLNSQEVTLKEDDIFTLTATVYPENATNKNVFWSTSDSNIVTVDNGVVKAIKQGEAVVTVTANNGISASCYFIVVEKPMEIVKIERIELNATEISGEEGFEFTLTASVYPEDATDKSVVWESSDENVVTISQSGKGRITGEGSAIITVTAEDGSGVKAECLVTGYAGIESNFANSDNKISIYSTDGILIKKDCKTEDLKSLTKGIYIVISGKDQYKISI